MRTAHQLDYVIPANQQRSCDRCVRRKLKCDRELPCSACAQSKTAGPCTYPTIEELYNPGFQPEFQIVEPGQPRTIQDPPVAKRPRRRKKRDTEDDDPAQDGYAELAITSAMNYQSDWSTTSPETYSSFSQPVDPTLLGTDNFSPIFSSEATFAEDNSIMGSSLHSGVQFDFRCSGFNWLDFDAPDVELAVSRVVHELENRTSTSLPEPTLDNQAPHIPVSQQAESILPWPFEHGHDGSTRCYLPPLREVLQESYQSSPGAQASALEGLVQVLSEKRLPKPEDVADPTILMGINLVKKLLDVYFANFQLIQPIFHTPTWTADDCPTMLLAAMACLGAVLSSDADAAKLSSAISDFCSPIISWMVRCEL